MATSEKTSSEIRRLSYLDTVVGIFILYMIFYHCCLFSDMNNNLFYEYISVIFSCFMAWFFFKSGMFHRTNITVKCEFIHTLHKLWRPYTLFWCIGIVIGAIKYCNMGDTNWVHYILTPFKSTLLCGSNGGAYPMWFLITLLSVRTLAPIFFNKGRWIIFGVFGVILCLINGKCGMSFVRPYYISNFFPAMFFYGLGFNIRNKQFDVQIFFFAFVIYLISFVYPSVVDFRVNSMSIGEIPLWYIYAPAGIIVFNNFCRKIDKDVWPITNIGKDSMWWFLAHWPILNYYCPVKI